MLHHQCGGHGNGSDPMAPPCSCAFLHGGCGGGNSSFSILFPRDSGKHQPIDEPSSSVDCTLSLGTPSTRSNKSAQAVMPNLCWDILSQSGKHASRGSTGDAAAAGGSNPLLLARRCANCNTTSTPLWRNGPRGPKSLCNACGIRYKKEERRAAASTSPSPAASSSVPATAAYGAYQRAAQHPWSCYAPTAAAAKYDGNVDDENSREVPYLSWRLNVVPAAQFAVHDRPGLYQYQ